MPRKRSIREYPVMLGGANERKVEALHGFTSQCRDSLFTDLGVQDVLLYEGYEPKGKRPRNFLDLHNGVWLRSEVAMYLGFLEAMTRALTPAPEVTAPDLKRISTLEETFIAYVEFFIDRSPNGEKERVQDEWMNSPETAKDVQAYRAALIESFDEFNLQYILGKIGQAVNYHIPREWKEHGVQERIKRVFDRAAFPVLDSAYYCMARSLIAVADEPYKKLRETELGKMFLLSREEAAQLVGKMRSGARESE